MINISISIWYSTYHKPIITQEEENEHRNHIVNATARTVAEVEAEKEQVESGRREAGGLDSLMTVREVAAHRSVSRARVYQLIRGKRIRAVRLSTCGSRVPLHRSRIICGANRRVNYA